MFCVQKTNPTPRPADSAVVTDMLKRIVRTENMKLNALEDALHAAIKVGDLVTCHVLPSV